MKDRRSENENFCLEKYIDERHHKNRERKKKRTINLIWDVTPSFGGIHRRVLQEFIVYFTIQTARDSHILRNLWNSMYTINSESFYNEKTFELFYKQLHGHIILFNVKPVTTNFVIIELDIYKIYEWKCTNGKTESDVKCKCATQSKNCLWIT